MNIEDLTVKQLRQLISAVRETSGEDDGHPFNIGGKYFIRTVTHHHTGVLVQVTRTELVLEQAAWISDDGRLQQALASGNFSEVEMFPSGKVIIGRGSLIDAVEIQAIPSSQK